ncbi:MAG TPA: lactonase family protein [Pyrinomonadaceae bacterium]|nr:lactonase family protein [Pyrinomonadaceae bacterium]
MDQKTLIDALARREFLKVAGVGALGLALPEVALGRSLAPGPPKELLVYVGTYTSGRSEGIYLYRLNPSSGELKHVATTKDVKDPSYLTLAPNRRYLYAVNELEEFAGKKSGALSAFAVNQRTGELRLLNQQPSLGGAPCYVVVDRTGRFVLVANYSGGNVAVLPVRRDGSLGEPIDVQQNEGSSINTERQQGPHAHCIELDPTNRFAYVCDLGADKIMIFRFDRRQGKLTAGKTPWVPAKPGAGPRHLTFHPSGKYAYVLNELNATVTAFAHDRVHGNLSEVQTVPTLPREPTAADTGADIHVSPDGRFLYCSNRGHDSIAGFMINPRNGKLDFIAHEPTGGKTPRNFVIDPTGAFLLVANQRSDNIVTFRRDRKTGRLTPAGHVAEAPSPVCLKFARIIER